MSKVSVILPIYNVEMYLRECLDSVTRQTLKELEIICVNDGSTDQSLDIIKEYAEKDNRIVVITGPNGGYGKAMNQGLDRATGEYIGIVEPDDYVSLTMFEDLYKIASENNLDWIKADFYRFTKSNNGDMKLTYTPLDSKHTRYGEILVPKSDSSLIKFVMNTWSGIYRREFLEKYHIRHNETPGASFQDNGFFFQTMIYAERAMIREQPYYRNRRDNPNSSVRNKEKVYCVNIEYDYIKDILMKDQEIWERFKYMYWWKKYHSYMFTINRIALQYKQEYIKRMSSEFKRGMQTGEFIKDIFTPFEWNNLSCIIENPEAFYLTYIRTSEEKRLEKELDAIKASTTYKVGRLIMAIPCAIKDKLTSK